MRALILSLAFVLLTISTPALGVPPLASHPERHLPLRINFAAFTEDVQRTNCMRVGEPLLPASARCTDLLAYVGDAACLNPQLNGTLDCVLEAFCLDFEYHAIVANKTLDTSDLTANEVIIQGTGLYRDLDGPLSYVATLAGPGYYKIKAFTTCYDPGFAPQDQTVYETIDSQEHAWDHWLDVWLEL